MFIIFGFRRRAHFIAAMQLRCPRCGVAAAQRLLRVQRWFTLFFIPVIPVSTRHLGLCTACGGQNPLTREQLDALVGSRPVADFAPGPS